jgi:4-phospho-D-threonate 3-dehydrogenase / 4-phospho-D-erythronate 3-dehydrogenase
LRLGITIGDSSGIGPEILLKAFREGQISQRFVAFGDAAVLRYYNDLLGYSVPVRVTSSCSDLVGDSINVMDAGLMTEADVTPGQLNRLSGAAAREYVVSATKAAMAGQIDAVVTLPMNKEATKMSDPNFVGHTELIGALCGAKDVTIMLASDDLIVTHVSTHVSLLQAIAMVKRERIQTIIGLTVGAVGRLKANPRIAVAGLNPHAGENGMFGDEEIREILPAVEWAKERGMLVSGPFAPDTLFYLAACRNQFDAIVCMYHDQGHIPLKLLDFEGGVNIALGLPIIRTSVDHGTAFDIAGKGIADERSLIEALRQAANLAPKAT